MNNLINKHWLGIHVDDKRDIRANLNQYMMAHHGKVPTFIRNKLVKLVVDIGRIDWPHFYPEFFSSILQVKLVVDISGIDWPHFYPEFFSSILQVKLVVDIGGIDWLHFYSEFFSRILQVKLVVGISGIDWLHFYSEFFSSILQVKLVVDISGIDWPHFYPEFFSSILQVKLVVGIGGIDWPHFYPEFFSSILQVKVVVDISGIDWLHFYSEFFSSILQVKLVVDIGGIDWLHFYSEFFSSILQVKLVVDIGGIDWLHFYSEFFSSILQVKLVVDIGGIDWLHFYSEFFSSILQVKLVVDISGIDWLHFYSEFFSSILQVVKLVVGIGSIDWLHFYSEFFSSILQVKLVVDISGIGWPHFYSEFFSSILQVKLVVDIGGIDWLHFYSEFFSRILQVEFFSSILQVKLVVDISSIDWPHFYPEFFSSILQVKLVVGIGSIDWLHFYSEFFSNILQVKLVVDICGIDWPHFYSEFFSSILQFKLVAGIGSIDWPHLYPEFFSSILQFKLVVGIGGIDWLHFYSEFFSSILQVKLVVGIGGIDWPHFYSEFSSSILQVEFFSSILQLVQQGETTSLGLILLHTASEELAVPREDIAMARKEELHRLLLQQVPGVLSLLNNVLEVALERHRHLVSATPPPSPTHGESAVEPKSSTSSVQLFSASPLRSDSLMSNLFKSPNSHIQLEALPPLDSATQELCALSLNCLSHLFSWIPLSSFITPTLLSTIFHFAGFGCETQGSRTMNSGANFNSMSCYLGVLAMNCINELLAKNCVPAEFEDFLLQMFQQTFYLLQKLTKDSSTCSSGNRLSELDDSYVDKFTEFLRLFVSIHLRRFESNTHFPVIEFLALLFKYTFRQPTNDGFYNCLDIWSTFLDYLFTKAKGRPSEIQAIIDRYKDALMSLVSHILQKLQFKYNQTQLEELDDETLDYDEETEWQHFLRHCLELVAKVAEILTAETFQILYTPFQEAMHIYFELERHIATGTEKRRLNIRGENDCRRLHCSLRDLSSLLQGLGRLADHFIAEKFRERFSDGHVLIERLVNMVVYGSRVKLFELTSTEQSVLQTDLIEVHAQALAAIKPFCHWLLQFYNESSSYPDQRLKFTEMLTTLLGAVTRLFDQSIPDKISHSAAHLLSSLVSTVRPNFLLQVPCIQGLYNSASQGVYRGCIQEIQLLLYRSLSLYLLLPWNNVPDAEQDWASRALHHQTFCHQMAAPLLHLKDTSMLINNKVAQEEAKPVLHTCLRLLVDWVEGVSGEVVKAKQICYQSMADIVNITLNVFPVFIHQPEVLEDILAFFLALFQSCRVQMGIPFTEQTIQTFMALFNKEQLAETLSHESGAAHRVIEK
ncbi:hypothetical protein DPMN_036164 [Dreissena polymorpha]|uniref:Exportin-1/Importin-beta-like domain-containing protein n=1 Tax=Dreissena polymorpha TaxID=45954 RepID=A0A9D4RNK6_DREPO|nr:hypothetical protein DPMN_036164 [Dreissena polymorpha]